MTLITTIILTSVVLCCIVAVLVYFSTAPWFIKLTALPATLILCTSLVLTTLDRMGAPINAFPEGKFSYNFHITADKGKTIILWATTEDLGERLYIFPYNRDDAKKLEDAKRKEQAGKPQQGEFPPQKREQGSLKIKDEEPRFAPEDFIKE